MQMPVSTLIVLPLVPTPLAFTGFTSTEFTRPALS